MTKAPRILLGMPSVDGKIPVKMNYILYNLIKKYPNLDIFHTIRTDISRARNTILEKSVVDKYDYLLFLDDDNPPEQEDFLDKLLALDKDMVTGLIASRQKPHKLCIFDYTINQGRHGYKQYTEMPQTTEPFEIANAGMGCCLIKTSVIKAVFKEYLFPCQMGLYWYYKQDDAIIREDDMDLYNLDDSILRYNKYASEDMIFFERATGLGFELWCDPTITCEHFGECSITVKDVCTNQ